jgi:hypothetical protein
MSNPAMRAMTFRDLLSLMNIPGVNSRWILENYFANLLGSQAVDKALLPVGAQSNLQQRRQAKMENGDFGEGLELPVAPEDAHFEHAEEHLMPMDMIVKNYNTTGQMTREQLAALTIGVEHTGQHMQYLSQDQTMKGAFQQLNPVFRRVASVTRGLLQQMQSQGGDGQPAMN